MCSFLLHIHNIHVHVDDKINNKLLNDVHVTMCICNCPVNNRSTYIHVQSLSNVFQAQLTQAIARMTVPIPPPPLTQPPLMRPTPIPTVIPIAIAVSH